MTTILLIRHATCDPVGSVLSGRTPSVHLNSRGHAQAEALAERLAPVALDAIYSSPLERTVQTAEAIARGRHLRVETMEELLELDFGRWTGRRFADLDGDEEWRRWNAVRSLARIPEGEAMLEVQTRALSALRAVTSRWPEGRCAVVSHGDLIRSTLAYLLGMPTDLMLRIEIRPASASVVQLGPDYVKVVCVNHTGDLPLT